MMEIQLAENKWLGSDELETPEPKPISCDPKPYFVARTVTLEKP